MKKSLYLLISLLVVGSVTIWSCSNSSSSPNNFQAPVQTIVVINATFTFTPIFTATPTPTSTATNTPTNTPTPYAVSTWTGFNAPSAIAVDKNGKVYVADTLNNYVERYNSNGTLDITWGIGGIKGKVPYNTPKGIAVDGNLNLYVVGNGNPVSEYQAFGTGVTLNNSFGTNSIAAGLSGPLGVAVNAGGTTIAVADTGNNRIVILGSAGSASVTYTVSSSVYGVAIDGNGNIFSSTGTSNTVVEVTSVPVTVIPGFNDPQGLWADNFNNLWVADKGAKQVEEFSGTAINYPPLVVFNNNGMLNAPAGVAVDPNNGTIYVVDTANNDVVKFTP